MSRAIDPTDDLVRGNLERRATRPMPSGLVAEISEALDRVDAAPRRARWRFVFRVPRLAMAAASIGVVAVVAATLLGLAASRQPAPAAGGYPESRALTTDELSRLMRFGNPPQNTTLVVDTAIEVKPDICPRNASPTLGRIAGVEPEICVFAATLAAARPPGATLRGTFAFQYLAPGYLLYVGPIASTPDGRYTFRVDELWPAGNETFLVDAWLGATKPPGNVAVSCAVTPPEAVDPLRPYGLECPDVDWLSETASPAVDYPSPIASGRPVGYRFVQAAGVRVVSGIPVDGPAVHGLWVVRWESEGCAAPSTASNAQGCRVWRVLSKVNPVDIPAVHPSGQPTVTPLSSSTPAPTPPHTPVPAGSSAVLRYPLSDGDFLALMVTGHLPAGAVVAVKSVVAPDDGRCPKIDGMATPGYLSAVDPVVCLYGYTSPIAPGKDFLVLRSLGDRRFTLLAPVAYGPSGLVYGAGDEWPQADFLAQGTLGDIACTDPFPAPSTCGALFSTASAGVRSVLVGAGSQIESSTGIYLVRYQGGSWQIVARLSDIPAAALPTPVQTPLPSTPSPTASPWARAGFIGPENRALTAEELVAAIISDPDHLDGRTAIASGPFPGAVVCAAASAGAPPTPNCAVLKIIQGDSRVWVVRLSAGMLKLVAPLSMPDGLPVTSLPAVVSATHDAEQLYVVDAGLAVEGGNACDTAGSACKTWLAVAGSRERLYVQRDGRRFANPISSIYPTPGLYVVRVPAAGGCAGTVASVGTCQAEIVARLEPVAP